MAPLTLCLYNSRKENLESMEMCTGRRGDSSPDGDWQPFRK